MASIAYKFLYMLTGMFLLFAIALTLAGKPDFWWWSYVVSAYYLAAYCDREAKKKAR